jgi:hypothetical protein
VDDAGDEPTCANAPWGALTATVGGENVAKTCHVASQKIHGDIVRDICEANCYGRPRGVPPKNGDATTGRPGDAFLKTSNRRRGDFGGADSYPYQASEGVHPQSKEIFNVNL